MSKPIIITVVNEKGGVGKTTTVLNAGAGLAKLGNKVLLVDLDTTQASLSNWAIGAIGESSVIDAFVDDEINLSDLIYETSIPNMDIVPANSKDTNDLELILSKDMVDGARSFKYLLESDDALAEYDYIIVDNPPKRGLVTINSLVAADFYFIPLIPGFLEIQGVGNMLSTISQCQKANPDLKNLGFLLTNAQANHNITKDTRKILMDNFKSEVFKTSIRPNTKFKTIGSNHQSIFQVEGAKGKGHMDYLKVCKEIEKRAQEVQS